MSHAANPLGRFAPCVVEQAFQPDRILITRSAHRLNYSRPIEIAIFLALVTGCGGSGKKNQNAPPSSAPVEVSVGSNLSAQATDVRSLLVCADFDRDGRPDLATVNAGGEVFIFQNNGTPFTAPFGVSNRLATEMGGANSVAAADLDRDGREDLVVGSVAGNVILFENPGPAANPFASAWTRRVINNLPLDAPVNALSTGDVNGDGFSDIVAGLNGNVRQEIVAFTSPRTLIFTTGNWNQSRSDIETNPDVRSLALADLDRDGDPDLITGSTDRLVVVWRNTDGIYPATSSSSGALAIGTAGAAVFAVASGDFDQDGFADIVSGGADAGGRTLLAWKNPGVGISLSPFTVENWSGGLGINVALFGFVINAVAVADLNNDTFPDLVVGAGQSVRDEVLHFTNDKSPFNGAWLQTDVADTLDDAFSVAAGDLDGDGQVDSLVGTRAEKEDFEVIAFENQNSAGAFGISSLRANLDSTGTFNARAVATANLDNDADADFVYGDEANRLVIIQNTGNPFASVGTRLTLRTLNDDVTGLSLADYDRDGDADVVVILSDDADQLLEDDRLVLFRNDVSADGNAFDSGPEWAQRDLSNSSLNFVSLASADFDGDASPDLVTADDGGVAVGSIRVWKNPFPAAGAANQFWASNRVETAANPSEPLAVSTGDFDLDGDVDIVAGLAGGEIILFQNDGTPFEGNWVARTITAGGLGAVRALAVADLDRDTDDDIAAGTANGLLRVFQNPGFDQAFSNVWSQGIGVNPINSNLLDSVNAVAFLDVELNGIVDLAIGTGSLEDFEVIVLQNQNTPFTAGSWLQMDVDFLVDAVRSLSIGDVNLDGLADLVLATGAGESSEIISFRN